MTKKVILPFVVFCAFFGVTNSILAQSKNVNVTITNIRSADGNISIGVFKDNESFDEEEPWKSIVFSKKSLVNGTLNISFYLPPGTYGLTLLDDENANDEMEYNWIGVPKEGFGFSDNYWHTGMTKPDISEFDIKVEPSKVTTTTMKVKYMLDRD